MTVWDLHSLVASLAQCTTPTAQESGHVLLCRNDLPKLAAGAVGILVVVAAAYAALSSQF